MSWKRSGYCCRCGECCVGNPYEDGEYPSNASQEMRKSPKVAGYCPLFSWISPGQGHCSGHIGVAPPGQEDPYYMAGCSAWPQSPSEIEDKPSCTYKFTWVDD